jgi:2',3'-cyclic-nucleotide 2'-phosphodiesterase (5'-nucleotidase family)
MSEIKLRILVAGDIYTESAHRNRGGYVNLAYLIDQCRKESDTLGFDKTILLLSGDVSVCFLKN